MSSETEISDEMVVAFAQGAQMGGGDFVSADPVMQRAMDGTKARIKSGLNAALEVLAASKGVGLGMADFLDDMAAYFDKAPTNGEDKTHWANVYNAANCRKAAAFIRAAEPHHDQ